MKFSEPNLANETTEKQDNLFPVHPLVLIHRFDRSTSGEKCFQFIKQIHTYTHNTY